ncbi:helix-turn-helix domain-containing protein [Agarivorans sp. QJM3NY_33]|uniref:helix-turn-helix domain-containing protein n=1 Tax=Agarivorans sp. QJM3NY_33 TaxID=3421432 RepID=UPI003D7D3796
MEWNPKLSDVITHLYQHSASLELTQFRSFVFTTVQELLQFDSAIWINISRIRKPIDKFDTFLFNQPPEMINNYHKVIYNLGLKNLLFEQAIKMENLAVSSQASTIPELYEQHCKPFGLEQGLTTVRKGIFNGVYSIISLYRNNVLAPFSEEDRQMLQWLAPHFVESFRQNLIHNFKNPQFDHCYNAICDSHGVFVESQTGFVERLGQYVNSFRFLSPFNEDIDPEKVNTITLSNSINIEVRNIQGLFHLQVAKLQASAKLSPREQQITAELVRGFPDKIIANNLNISSKTVRNQLSDIYKKLHVRSRAEAISLLLSS